MIPKEASKILESIKYLGYSPRGKEVKFLKDVKFYIEKDMLLTKPMADYLEGIYKKSSGGGHHQNRGYV